MKLFVYKVKLRNVHAAKEIASAVYKFPSVVETSVPKQIFFGTRRYGGTNWVYLTGARNKLPVNTEARLYNSCFFRFIATARVEEEHQENRDSEASAHSSIINKGTRCFKVREWNVSARDDCTRKVNEGSIVLSEQG